MKKLSISFRRKSNRLISYFLSLLGFGVSVGLNSCDITPACEYGTPHATFKVIGNVQSEQNAENIEGIKVKMGWDSSYTDANGNYSIQTSDFPGDQAFPISFSDVDGSENGTFQQLDTIAEFTDPQFEGKEDGWYDGATELTLDIDLKSEE